MSISTTSSKTLPASNSGRVGHAEISVSVCLDCGTPIPARLVELARMDLMLLTDRPLRFGTPIHLAIFSDLTCAVTHNKAIVHWARPNSTGWEIGAFLTEPLPDRLTEQFWDDLRTNLRYECNWKAWVLWQDGGELEPCRILNYSLVGLRMRVDRMVPINSGFSIFGPSGSRDSAVISGRVQWCRAVEDTVQIGGIIPGHKGRELPRLFRQSTSVHVKPDDATADRRPESLETLRCEQLSSEQFLSRSEQT